ncbi:MAG TPA: hypothetical protein VGH90_12420 [Chthoniobacteraceae bacterium]
MPLLENPAPRAAGAARNVLERLAAADRILQRERGLVGFLRLAPWLAALIPAAFAIDVIWHLGAASRLALVVAAILLAIAAIAWRWSIGWVHRNSPEHTARVLESRDPRLGSKLINLLQLREQEADTRLSPLTRQLAGQAVEDCAAGLQSAELLQLAATDGVRLALRRAGYGLLAVLVLLVAGFDISRVEAPRFLDPFGDHPPYSFTRLEITEPADGAQVVYGQGLLFNVRSSGHRPSDLFLSFYPEGHPLQTITIPMFDKGERGYSQQLDGIKSNLVVYAQTRDAHSVSKQRRVSVLLTPKLEKAWVKITPPAYTGLPPEERPLQFKSLKVLEGSLIEFRLQSNRPLGAGQIEIVKSPREVEAIALEPSAENEVSASFTAIDSGNPDDSNKFNTPVTPPPPAVEKVSTGGVASFVVTGIHSPVVKIGPMAQLRFSLVDRDGHASDEKWELALNVTHDLPPEVQITNPPNDSFVAMDFKMDVVAEASDDYGVKTLRIHRARNDKWVDPKVTTPTSVTRNLRDSIALDFKQMDIEAGDTFSFFADAIDTAPAAHLARSPVVSITVISTDDYNDYLREQLDLTDIEAKYSDLFNQLHDLVDEQRKLSQQIDALKQQMAEAKDPAALAPKLDQLLAKQNEINSKLNKLADSMDNFVREKPLYDIESDVQDVLRQKAQQIRDSTAQDDADSQKVGQESSKPDGGRQMNNQMLSDLKQASDAQAQRLGETEDYARNEVEQPLKDMSKLQQIMEDLNRVEDLDKAQRNLVQQAKAYAKPGPLSREDQIALQDIAAAEKQIGADLDAVENKLWDDGEAAKEQFPKAAQSAKDISKKMGDLRLQMIANQATDAMVDGRGIDGAQLAERLAGELDKLFSQGQQQKGQMGDELDSYLGLSRNGPPMHGGNSFKQMMMSRKSGRGQSGFGLGRAGQGGRSGSAMMMGPNANVLGNESAVSHESNRPVEKGQSHARPLDQTKLPGSEKADVLHDVPAMNRESSAVESESSFDQYGDLVEKYFKAITKPAPANAKDPAPYK